MIVFIIFSPWNLIEWLFIWILISLHGTLKNHGRIYYHLSGDRYVKVDLVNPFLPVSCITYSLIHMFQIFKFGTEKGKPAAGNSEKHSYVLQPVSGNAKYSKDRQDASASKGQPLQKAAVNLDDVTLCLSKVGTSSLFSVPSTQCPVQNFILTFISLLRILYTNLQNGYRDLLKLADNFTAFNQRLKYAHYRPNVSVKTDPKSWWKYACRAVSDMKKKARLLSSYFIVDSLLAKCANKMFCWITNIPDLQVMRQSRISSVMLKCRTWSIT